MEGEESRFAAGRDKEEEEWREEEPISRDSRKVPELFDLCDFETLIKRVTLRKEK